MHPADTPSPAPPYNAATRETAGPSKTCSGGSAGEWNAAGRLEPHPLNGDRAFVPGFYYLSTAAPVTKPGGPQPRMTLAAIDIGSNAVRLLIMEAVTAKDGEVSYAKQNFLRVPLRLGSDVFSGGFITDEKISDLTDTLKAFRLLMRLHRVSRYRACATSAMRDARNRGEVIASVERESGITVEVISGDEEARLLYDALRAASGDQKRPCLFMDVGGGSTEISLFTGQQMLFRRSFDIGTIRMMQGTVSPKEMDEMKKFVASRAAVDLQAVGTGGNINKLHALARLKRSQALSLNVLKDFLASMEGLSVEQRMARYHLRPDRADVILPALQIYCSLMRWGGIAEIYVPKIGLANGIISSLYLQYGPGPLS